ncbi:MAG: lamin tail domain-containing protein [Bacteroidia bacterium]|nr:lamin tail domain-containing protein [Bacteroidia bacterium]
MKVKINKVNSPGNLAKERVGFVALETVEISNYAVMDHSFSNDGDLSDIGRHVYKFPKKVIPQGDKIVLYTKRGTNSAEQKEGYTVHFFYWNRAATVWNANDRDTCILMEVHDTQVVKVNAD